MFIVIFLPNDFFNHHIKCGLSFLIKIFTKSLIPRNAPLGLSKCGNIMKTQNGVDVGLNGSFLTNKKSLKVHFLVLN